MPNTGSVGGGSKRLVPWIFILNNDGMIFDRVKVSWSQIRPIYLKIKQKQEQARTAMTIERDINA